MRRHIPCHRDQTATPGTTIKPQILSPSSLDPTLLDSDAVRSLQRMQARGFEAYLVGGCVRDLLVGVQPKDFDIATAARPQQVKRTFPRNCRIIGRRFKLAHLHFEHNTKILEVATFRTSPTADDGDSEDLLITRDNEFGTAEEDALRRDFTVNALFMDPISDRIIDYVGGLADVKARLLRTIGDPVVRFREDPVRIIRAAKFAGRLGFRIEETTYEAMAEVAADLSRAAPPRLLEEILRLLRGGHSLESFQVLRDIGALRVVLPVIADFLAEAPEADRVRFWRTLEAVDHKVASGVALPPPVLLGALFEGPVRLQASKNKKRSATSVAEALIGPFACELRLPRRDAGSLKRICGVQQRFSGAGPRRFKVHSFLRDIYFDEALQLFELACMASGEGLAEFKRWTLLATQARAEDAADGDAATSSEARGERGRRSRRGGRKDRAPRDDRDVRGNNEEVDEGAERDEGDERAEIDGGDERAEIDGGDERAAIDGGDEQDARASQDGRDDEPSDTAAPPRRRRRGRRRGRGTNRERNESGDADGAQTREPRDDESAVRQRDDADTPDIPQDDGAGDVGPRSEAGDDAPRSGKRRRRRRGRGSRGGAEPAATDRAEDSAAGERAEKPGTVKARRTRKASKPTGEAADAETADSSQRGGGERGRRKTGKTDRSKAKTGKTRGKEGKSRGRDGKGRDGRSRDGRGRDRRDRVAPRDRTVEVLEPEAIDVSAFDVELGPRDVPSFGVIIEESADRKKRKRVPKVPLDGDDGYKPPKPPSLDPAPTPPPPPPADDDGDEFGDW